MTPASEPKPGLLGSFRRLMETLAAVLQNRLELLLVEAQEERWRFFETILLAGIVLVLALMILFVATFTLVLVCVQAHRLDLVVGLGLLYLAATLGCYWRLRARLKSWAPFSATLAELKKDKTCLEGRN